MKKLILYNHNEEKLLELDVFMEGEDFKWESPTPIAFWLGTIRLVDSETLEKEAEERKEALKEHVAGEVIPTIAEYLPKAFVHQPDSMEYGEEPEKVEPEPENEPFLRLIAEEKKEVDEEIRKEKVRETQAAIDEERKEKDEPETVSNKSVGGKGACKAKHPKNAKRLSTKATRRKVNKGS